MGVEKFLFYVFALTAVFASLGVISSRNPVRAALFLVLAFVATAGVWLLLQAEFLGIVLILVYVGAVMVLFLFVIMMLDINLTPLKEGFARYLPIGIVVALVVLAEMAMVLNPTFFGLDNFPSPVALSATDSNTKMLGQLLFTEYLFAFELAAVLLLLSIVAAIVLTLRRRHQSEALYQDVGAQVRVQASDRLTMVKMAPTVKSNAPEQGAE
ncbi:MAG: NADH:ubiquinone oxidoreductase subunit J [Thiotrichales bacterium 32-46-8]|jgi:NADH:ubiquinone oxidoreductase subunit 6 (chain J)|nr:NADH-quinone oxidoreductase subunit J [Gammaproteobacteria bacterium]OYX07637.1 MAG: NADH:ubiquinone oxidoreductase subunit J [Thiotrichales bacterium 32-46-8]OYZ09910.1 MAG: NADH:ubiquinone oxidoreductase subunit J [Thiotrichales bacterium 16-46-22]OZA20602.1 MAG: NADH:ubiquinone oxidoreductase subunit J [Thiotrichales bacterium 17-46-47]OZA98413.1 MAG: NADH:ubiquinone oxidoreductase subunit J [Thiotrichales bacterium 34-46-19]OZB87182.1 MAG: NADH:ubiquinone oxidoreductase subunit J [Thiot